MKVTTLICAALFAATVGAAAAQGAPTAPPEPGGSSAAPAATPNAELLARAKSWFEQLQAGKIDRTQLATATNGALTDAQVQEVHQMIGSLGTPMSFEQQHAMSQNGMAYAIYLVTFADGKKLNFAFGVDAQGKVAGLRLTPVP